MQSIDKVSERFSDRIEKLETNINTLKSDLPFVYALREDFIRSVNNIEETIDDLGEKVDKNNSDLNIKIDRILEKL